jgi:PTH1 family peptidyl-tRNA hydrolase
MHNTSKIQLIVGLGNPGPQYQSTRHNAGAWFVEALAQEQQVNLREEKRFRGLFAQYTIAGNKIILLIPQTYMNLSGDSVLAAAHYFQIPAQNILVAHDELDLPVGTVKLKTGGGHAGHNGLKDIINKLGSKEFWRLRIGIDHPRQHNIHQAVADYVLAKPSTQDDQKIEAAIDQSVKIADLLYQGAFDQAMQKLHSHST